MASREIEPGLVVAGKYRIVRELGEGGMGAVYLAQHIKTEERFALKILNPSVAHNELTRERFRREARTPARIDSDHVCRVVDTDIAVELDEAPFLVMEYLRGQNFQELSEQLGPLPPREVLVYLRQVAIALDKAHSLGVVHRDLKPENLFLTTRDDGSPCVKVLDFGIAKLSGATGDLAIVKATNTGDVFGTPLYMSPEQCKSEGDRVGPKSDVWALGLLAHRLLVGDDFWTAETLTHLIAQIAYEPLKKASERGANFGDAYDAWFAKCCAREVEQRFESAMEAVQALATALGEEALLSTNDGPPRLIAAERARISISSPQLKQTSSALTRSSPSLHDTEVAARRGRRGLLVAAAVSGVALGVAAVFIARGSFQEEPAQPASSTEVVSLVSATASASAATASSSAMAAAVASAPASASSTPQVDAHYRPPVHQPPSPAIPIPIPTPTPTPINPLGPRH